MQNKIKTVLLSFTIMTTASIQSDYSIKVLTETEVQPLLPFVATLRINIFREYPYLYEGNFQEEMNDLERCTNLKHNALAIAYHNDIPVGFLYGIPLTEFAPHFENAIVDIFKNKDLDPAHCYYFADIIILPEHRGNHLSERLFTALEAYAQEQGYHSGSFITESHDEHPLKPKDYKLLDPLWNSLNYKKTDIITYGSWQTHQPDGSVARQQHSADMWFKNFLVK